MILLNVLIVAQTLKSLENEMINLINMPQDALEEAGKMMHIPMNKLPKLAIKYLHHLSNKIGCCGEILFLEIKNARKRLADSNPSGIYE